MCNSIVIVTCDRDREQFQIQCQSIGKYLESSQYYIIVNEDCCDEWVEWFNQTCKSYLENHNVHIHRVDYLINLPTFSGTWRRSGFLKLYASQWITEIT